MDNADDVLFVLGEQQLTRGEFADRSRRAQAFLEAKGIGPGDRIGIAFRNRPQFYELMSAATALGGGSLPIAWRLKQEEVQYLVEDSGVKLVFFDPDSAARMEGLNGVSLDEYENAIATIDPAGQTDAPTGPMAFDLYSSGTTGRPKAIQREPVPPELLAKFSPGQNGLLNMLGVEQPGEVHLICGPLYHSQPIGFGATAMGAGHSVVMIEGGFDAEECLRVIDRNKVTWLTCVPTHLIRIMALPEETRAKYDVSSIKAILHSAAPCPRDVKAAVLDYFPEGSIWEVYGGTEGAMSMISPEEWSKKPGSVGRAFPEGTELRIMDEAGNILKPGEVGLVYSRTLMKFSYKDSSQLDDETWRGDFFTLGDMGYLDVDGYLFLTDRKKDMIISGGANIYPAEVESTLFNHPAVGDAAVIGVPDDDWGERVKAIIEPRAEVTGDEIIAFCREHLAHYKCPTSVDLVDKLPRDPSGKIRKRELREPYWQDAGRTI
ncbi:MAG: AMP-binding protein [Novosphingobium sp.]|nr:AMP-binding protein [Novosphingobium sp.]